MIVVNLFGDPGCGKSTGAAHIFSRLKQSGVSMGYEQIVSDVLDILRKQRST